MIYMPSFSLAFRPGPKIRSLQNGRRLLRSFQGKLFAKLFHWRKLPCASLTSTGMKKHCCLQCQWWIRSAWYHGFHVPGSRGCNEGARPLATFPVSISYCLICLLGVFLWHLRHFETFWDMRHLCLRTVFKAPCPWRAPVLSCFVKASWTSKPGYQAGDWPPIDPRQSTAKYKEHGSTKMDNGSITTSMVAR